MVFTRCRDAPVVACVLATLAFAAIGFADDRGKLASGRNDAGLSPVAKLAAQSAVASALFAFLSVAGDASGAFRVDTAVPLLGGVVLELGRGFWALAAFATVAESNAVNVADGLDGLAASASAIALCALGAVTLRLGRAELAAFAFSTAGAAAGFLVVNRHPAACFMGDCGSLALGGALGAVAGAAGGAATFPLFVVTGAFVVETTTATDRGVFESASFGIVLVLVLVLVHAREPAIEHALSMGDLLFLRNVAPNGRRELLKHTVE